MIRVLLSFAVAMCLTSTAYAQTVTSVCESEIAPYKLGMSKKAAEKLTLSYKWATSNMWDWAPHIAKTEVFTGNSVPTTLLWDDDKLVGVAKPSPTLAANVANTMENPYKISYDHSSTGTLYFYKDDTYMMDIMVKIVDGVAVEGPGMLSCRLAD